MKKLIIANWKSHKNRQEVETWMDVYEQKILQLPPALFDKVEVAIAPPMPSLMFVSNRLLNPQLAHSTKLAVQDLSPLPAGSYTGAVSARNLEGFNVSYALVGHSERRQYFQETANDIAHKVEMCIEAHITPIVCVDVSYLKEQAQVIPASLYLKCVFAYEPKAAIGNGANAPLAQVVEVTQRIKTLCGTRVLYGGSVNEQDIMQYMDVTDGAIVGTAALDVEEFIDVLKSLV